MITLTDTLLGVVNIPHPLAELTRSHVVPV